jgi:hypothetical protein
MTTPIKETSVLKLDNIVVVRKMPMTNHGCTALRVIRDHMMDVYEKKNNKKIDIPFPTVFALMMDEYLHLKNIKVEEPKEKK